MSVTGFTYTTPGVEVAEENDDDIIKEFGEFLAAKKQQESEAAASEDFDVEIWDEKGRGVRTKRSHAKPFLQSLGIDLDPEPEKKEGEKPEKKTPAKSTPKPPANSVRKYFTAKGK